MRELSYRDKLVAITLHSQEEGWKTGDMIITFKFLNKLTI